MFLAIIQGYITSFSLILAIGSQNAFVLRQGIRREHVAAVVAVCAISDAILIAVGVAGFGAVAAAVPWLVPAMRWFGAAFLLWYGFQRFQAARKGGEALMPASKPRLRSMAGAAPGVPWSSMIWAWPLVFLVSQSAAIWPSATKLEAMRVA